MALLVSVDQQTGRGRKEEEEEKNDEEEERGDKDLTFKTEIWTKRLQNEGKETNANDKRKGKENRWQESYWNRGRRRGIEEKYNWGTIKEESRKAGKQSWKKKEKKS